MSKKHNPKLFLILAGVALLLGSFLVYSQYGAMTEAQNKVTVAQQEVDKAETIRKDLASSKAAVEEIQMKLAHLERGVQDYQYVPKMLKELASVGKTNGITVTGVRPIIRPVSSKPDAKETRKPYDEISIELKGRGEYADVLKFLTALQDFPQIVAVRTLALIPKTDSEHMAKASPNIDITAELRVLVFPETVPLTKGTQSATTKEASTNG